VLESKPTFGQAKMETVLKGAASLLPLAADGACFTDPYYGPCLKWFGVDYGAGFLQADAALLAAGQ
jgi:hypothetical protein